MIFILQCFLTNNSYFIIETKSLNCYDYFLCSHAVGCLDGLNLHSNEFVFEGSVSTGKINRKIESPLDKVEKFKSIKSDLDSTTPSLSVYIGDSVGDLLCLLEADIGIVVGSSTTLRRVSKPSVASFVPFLPGLVEMQSVCRSNRCPFSSLVWSSSYSF
jgi:phosphoserine phosphatase